MDMFSPEKMKEIKEMEKQLCIDLAEFEGSIPEKIHEKYFEPKGIQAETLRKYGVVVNLK